MHRAARRSRHGLDVALTDLRRDFNTSRLQASIAPADINPTVLFDASAGIPTAGTLSMFSPNPLQANNTTHSHAAHAAAPSCMCLDDLWTFPCVVLGEFGQNAGGEAQFVAEWANCGPLACLCVKAKANAAGDPLQPPTPWPSAGVFGQSASPPLHPMTQLTVASPGHGPLPAAQVVPQIQLGTPMGPPAALIASSSAMVSYFPNSPAMPPLPNATNPPPFETTAATGIQATPPGAAGVSGPSASAVHLTNLTVTDNATAMFEVPAPVQAICRAVLGRVIKQEISGLVTCMPVALSEMPGICRLPPNLTVAVASERFQVADIYARGGSTGTGRKFELAVMWRDHDALSAAWPLIRPILRAMAECLFKASKTAAERVEARVDSVALNAYRCTHSNALKPLRELLQGTLNFDRIMMKGCVAIFNRIPISVHTRQAMVKCAMALRPEAVGFVTSVAAGSTALVPQLVMPEPEQRTTTRPHMVSPGHRKSISANHCSKPVGGLFPDEPSLSQSPNLEPGRLGGHFEDCRSRASGLLADWLNATHKRCRAMYEENVVLPLTLLICNDGTSLAGAIAVKPRNGASTGDVWRFQRAAEAVFGRLSWHTPPAVECVGAAAKAANTTPHPTRTCENAAAVIWIDGCGGDASQHPTLAADFTGLGVNGPQFSYSFASMMAARCTFDDRAARVEAEECLKCDVESARSVACFYTMAVWIRSAFVSEADLDPVHFASEPAKQEKLGILDRMRDAFQSKKSVEEKRYQERLQHLMAVHDRAMERAAQASLIEAVESLRAPPKSVPNAQSPITSPRCAGKPHTNRPEAKGASAMQQQQATALRPTLCPHALRRLLASHVHNKQLLSTPPDEYTLEVMGVPLCANEHRDAMTLMIEHIACLAIARHLQP
jgi:hypothetical protein